jgi:RecG-like helicase
MRYYPRRYQQRGVLTPIADLPLGESVTVLAEVRSAVVRQMHRRRGSLLTVRVTDGQDDLELTFFQGARMKHMVPVGRRALFSGVVTLYQGKRQLTHPTVVLLDDDEDDDEAAARADRPLPIYPAVKEVDSESIRRAVGTVLDVLGEVDGCRWARRWRRSTGRRTTRNGGWPAAGWCSRRPSCCRPRWPADGSPRPPGRPPPGSPGRTACWPRSTSGCRSP